MKLTRVFSSLLRPSSPPKYRMHRHITTAPEPNLTKRRRLDPTMMHSIPSTISLTLEEEKLCRLLVDVAAEVDAAGKEGKEDDNEPLTLRFTGGWVRDKLLGEQCHDIDVGINKMTGFDFATRLYEFLGQRQADYGIQTGNIHKIGSNPEKSKHLETATTRILGLDIDFVNLRSEKYTDDSRIPHMVCVASCRCCVD